MAKPGGDGSFPAILVLPDCIGLTPFVRETLTARLASWGYVALAIDSWTTRKAQAGCFLNGQEPPGVDRIADAYGGLFYLAGLPFVQRDRVGLLGFATGGVFVLTLAEPQTQSSVVNSENLSFKGGVVYYAPCAELIQKPAFPLLILVGRDDQRTGAHCEEGARPTSTEGNPVEVHVYPGVKHGFADPHWGRMGRSSGFRPPMILKRPRMHWHALTSSLTGPSAESRHESVGQHDQLTRGAVIRRVLLMKWHWSSPDIAG